MSSFAKVTDRRESWGANHSIPRHRHDQAYAAVVLSGAYEECGSRGRFRVTAGDVLLHDAFDAHLDRFQKSGAQILNLIVDGWPSAFAHGRVRDPDEIAHAAEHSPSEASALLRTQLVEANSSASDWPDLLAHDLLNDHDCRLDEWAARHKLAAETVSRGFGKVFGVTPAAFRLEARARCAFRTICEDAMPLAAVAAKSGFADQAHMSRAVRALTGASPGDWRRSNSFKTQRARAA